LVSRLGVDQRWQRRGLCLSLMSKNGLFVSVGRPNCDTVRVRGYGQYRSSDRTNFV